MHATLPLLKSTDFPAIARRALDTLQVNVGYRCNQACHHCHVNASPDRSEMMARRYRRRRAARARRTPDPDARHHRRRAGAQPALPPSGARGPATRRPRDRSLQPHDPERAGLRGPRRISRRARASRSSRRCRATRRRTSTGSAAITCSNRRSSRSRSSTRSGYGIEGARSHAQSRLQPARAVPAARAGPARSRLQARARRALRRRVQSLVHARQHADQALRIDARHAGQVRELHGASALRAQSGESRRRHVPDARVGRLPRLSVRLRFQPDARDPARRRRQAAAPRHGSCSSGEIDTAPIAVADHCYGCTAGQGSSCGGALA